MAAMTNLLTPTRTSRLVRQSARRDKVRRAYDRLRPRVETRAQNALRRFWHGMNATVLERLDKAGGHPAIEELIHPAEIRQGFNATMSPQWRFELFTGFDFEHRWIGTAAKGERQSFYVRQEVEPDETKGPTIAIEMNPATERAVADFLTTKRNTIWRDIWKSYTGKLKNTLAEGLKDGDSTKDLTARVQAALKGYSRAAAERVARTETTGAMNFGQQSARVQAGIEEKEWSSAKDNRTRGSLSKKGRRSKFNHVAPDGQVQRNTSAFLVSGELLMFPGDTSKGTSAGNICNCRCASVAFFGD